MNAIPSFLVKYGALTFDMGARPYAAIDGMATDITTVESGILYQIVTAGDKGATILALTAFNPEAGEIHAAILNLDAKLALIGVRIIQCEDRVRLRVPPAASASNFPTFTGAPES